MIFVCLARCPRPAIYSRRVSPLERFKEAQDEPYGGFADALAELRAGRKTGHWIWYIFPQLSGLGRSGFSEFYGIAGVKEAADYLRDPVLRGRLLLAATTVAERLRERVPLTRLTGASIDAVKLVSSLTLFGAIARKMHAAEANEECRRLADASDEILAIAESEGYPRCQYTLRALAGR
jgi:uncharacterized protein (DUF1810 family)